MTSHPRPTLSTLGINVRSIVMEVIGKNPEAQQAHLHDPAMQYGVEVVVGTLSRVGQICLDRGDSPRAVQDLIEVAAVACSLSGGAEDETAIAASISSVWP